MWHLNAGVENVRTQRERPLYETVCQSALQSEYSADRQVGEYSATFG